jgi:Activator of Hsp90 ATPase homolog 1-like protein
MTATAQAPAIDDLMLNVADEIHVDAPIEIAFEALLDQLGPSNETPEGVKMNMKIEAWPGGRWYRDLGDGNGHFWAVVQAIKKPTLLEMHGPLFMSYPVSSNVQYRLSEDGDGTLIKFRHSAFGLISEEHRKGVTKGWGFINGRARERAEAAAKAKKSGK